MLQNYLFKFIKTLLNTFKLCQKKFILVTLKKMEKTNGVENSLHSNLSSKNSNYVSLCKENIVKSNKVVEKGEYCFLFNFQICLQILVNKR